MIKRVDVYPILDKSSPEGLTREEKLIWILGDLMTAAENYFGHINPKRSGHIYQAALRIMNEVGVNTKE